MCLSGSPPSWLINRNLGLAYKPIPKNGNSYLKAVFLLNHPLASDYDPSEETALKYLHRNDRSRFWVKSHQELLSPGMVKFVILRCPARRFASGYCDKFLKGDAMNLRTLLCDQMSKHFNKIVTPKNVTFSDFLDFTLSIPDKLRDRHFRSQTSFLGGVVPDRCFPLENLDSAIHYLTELGMDPASFDTAKRGLTGITKKTKYRRSMADRTLYLGNAEAAQIRGNSQSMMLPGFDQLFSKNTLERFLKSFAKDVTLYCSTLKIDESTYRDGVFKSLETVR